MSFTSITFLAFVIIAIVLSHVSNGRVWRPWAMLALSLTFVGAAMMGWEQALLLGGFCIFIFFSLVAVDGGRGRWLFLVLTIEVSVFIWLKQYTLVSALAPLPAAVGLAGISYILFRGIHLTVDVATGALKRRGPAGYRQLSAVLSDIHFRSNRAVRGYRASVDGTREHS